MRLILEVLWYVSSSGMNFSNLQFCNITECSEIQIYIMFSNYISSMLFIEYNWQKTYLMTYVHKNIKAQIDLKHLTHWGWVMHICCIELSHHWFRKWLVTWLVPSHYLNQCSNSDIWILGSIFQWYFNQNTIIFMTKNAFECRLENSGHFVSASMC